MLQGSADRMDAIMRRAFGICVCAELGAPEKRRPLRDSEGPISCSEAGSGGRTRTYDQVINSHPLYQLSYAGAVSCSD